jgi:nucleotide-binding universal stress UspA family protein
MFHRILLAVDDSPASEVATAFATAFAHSSGASVHVVYINERMVGGQGLTLDTRPEATELVARAVRQLTEGGVRASGSSSVASHRQVPARLADEARARQVDAIVLGSHRPRSLGRLFSPKVRQRVTRLTSLPVLTAPSPLKVTSMQRADALEPQFDQALTKLSR